MMASMIIRTGFVVAVLIGLAGLFDLVEMAGALLILHIAAGLLVLVGILAAAIRVTKIGRGGSGLLWAAAAVSLAGAALGLNAMMREGSGIIHLLVMLLAVALVEIGTSRAKRL